jgi:hypothetical protein
MTTEQLGIPISQHTYPPAPHRPNLPISRPPGVETPPIRQRTAPNKPNLPDTRTLRSPSIAIGYREISLQPGRKTNPNKPNRRKASRAQHSGVERTSPIPPAATLRAGRTSLFPV